MEFPEGDFMSAYSIDLIKRMLTVDPNERLGCFAGAEKDIMNHPFYDDIDWEQLSSKKAEVPFVPKVKDPLDGSNFDDYSKLEAKEKNAKMTKLTSQVGAGVDFELLINSLTFECPIFTGAKIIREVLVMRF